MAAANLGLVLECADPDKGRRVLVRRHRLHDDRRRWRLCEPKTGKNRMHFDIETPHVDDEVARLKALGAARIIDDPIEEHGNRWVIMADPEGNEFCVCDGGAS